jgi:zinc protease
MKMILPVVLSAVMAAPADRPLLPFQAVEKTLPNGLKVIVVPTGLPNIVSIQIPVQTGSRNEVEAGKSGFAHFFEHMMFRGTPTYPPDKYQQIVTQSGARQNAYTSDDLTNYHTTFAKEDLETILKIEADRFQNLSYPLAAFQTEARAVLGEYNKNSAEPLRKLFEVQRDAAFTTHTYKHTTMGFLKDVEDMPNQFEYSKVFFQRWYRPEHAALIIAGDVDPAQVMPLVEKYWGGWKAGNAAEVKIPAEPAATGPKYAHVPWSSPTLPWVAVAFHGPAFSDQNKDYAAMDLALDLAFGPTSDLYRRLVEQEQKVDQFFGDLPMRKDPPLLTVGARVKDLKDAVAVRDEVLRTFARLRDEPPSAERVAEAKSNARYGFVRRLDNTESIASVLATFVSVERDYDTLNDYFRVYETLTPADLQAVARKYFTDEGLVVTTLSQAPLPPAMAQAPKLATFAAASTAAPSAPLKVVTVPSQLPQLNIKLLFRAGSAHDPKGKEGLAALSAAMIAEAGSRALRIDEIRKALFPMAGSIDAQVDKEMTTFTLGIHRDNWTRFADLTLPMLTEPGFREDDFQRLKDQQLNALTQDLRNNNEEELGKERLQAVLFAGTPYAHPVLGTVAGVKAITLDDVKDFARRAYTRGNVTVGVAGDAPADVRSRLDTDLAGLPAGEALPAPAGVKGHMPRGKEVDIVQKETRATAISFGHPIEVTRAHPDFPALSVARAWLGEHRASMSHLYGRIREVRGMNYGDYAYIEAFPRGMFQFFPDPNLARRQQIFEVWIRPVAPENAHMALRIAVHELERLIKEGLSQEDFESTRNYLLKNVYLLTSTQDNQLGYRLDSDWYGIPEYTSYMREQLGKLTRDQVNAAVRKHLSAENLAIVIITRDAQALKDALVADGFSAVKYDGEKPAELLAEDKVIGARKLGIRADAVRITPVDEVFAQ